MMSLSSARDLLEVVKNSREQIVANRERLEPLLYLKLEANQDIILSLLKLKFETELELMERFSTHLDFVNMINLDDEIVLENERFNFERTSHLRENVNEQVHFDCERKLSNQIQPLIPFIQLSKFMSEVTEGSVKELLFNTFLAREDFYLSFLLRAPCDFDFSQMVDIIQQVQLQPDQYSVFTCVLGMFARSLIAYRNHVSPNILHREPEAMFCPSCSDININNQICFRCHLLILAARFKIEATHRVLSPQGLNVYRKDRDSLYGTEFGYFIVDESDEDEDE